MLIQFISSIPIEDTRMWCVAEAPQMSATKHRPRRPCLLFSNAAPFAHYQTHPLLVVLNLNRLGGTRLETFCERVPRSRLGPSASTLTLLYLIRQRANKLNKTVLRACVTRRNKPFRLLKKMPRLQVINFEENSRSIRVRVDEKTRPRFQLKMIETVYFCQLIQNSFSKF